MSRKKKLALYLAVVVILSAFLFTWFELFFHLGVRISSSGEESPLRTGN